MAWECKFPRGFQYEMFYFSPVLTQILMWRHILVNISNMKFHESPSGGSRPDTGGRTHRYNAANGHVWHVKGNVKCTLVQALRFCTGRTARRGSRAIALPFHDHGTRRGEGSASPPGHSLTRERPGTHCTGGWMGPRAGLDGCGKSRPPTGIRSPDRPARSHSLYRLCYPAHCDT